MQVYDLLGCPGGEKEKGGGPNEELINRRADYTFQVTNKVWYSDSDRLTFVRLTINYAIKEVFQL